MHAEFVSPDAGPRSVPQARHWAADVCRDLGRDDLVDSAELAVSELVTNAVVHGEPPLRVWASGSSERPRFEVHDGSPVVPEWPAAEADDELLTGGRGLDLVARASVAWGARLEAGGKTLWFEPAAELDEHVAPFEVAAP